MALGWVVLALVYLAGLFWLARWGDKDTPLARKLTSHPVIYSMALAIYCTAWTFYGGVGEASRNSWQYLPIFLGPILVYLVGYRFIYKMILVSKKQHITTIADFISSRYGKRQSVALLVTLIALLATIPYVALQLKAIGSSFQILAEQESSELIVLLATVFIAFFSIYFGTQRSDVTEYRRGLILAVAFESTIKLIALVAVALFAYVWAQDNDSAAFDVAIAEFNQMQSFSSFAFIAQTIMAAAAVICLPRQFHVAVVDNLSLGHLKTARWLFPVYLLILSIVIPVIAAAGKATLGGSQIEPDTYVLMLALMSDSKLLEMLVFVGGLSAATAMIIIATLTLSTMITNDVVLPKLLARKNQQPTSTDYSRMILIIRRVVIGLLLIFAYIYQQQMTNSRSLASIGLIAFSLVIQLIPSIIGALYWRKGHAHGVFAGLITGVLTWILWLMLPMITDSNPAHFQSDTISMGAMLSLATNTLAYLFFSYLAPDRLADRIQAQAFVRPREAQFSELDNQHVKATIGDLATLLTTFLGESRTSSLIDSYARRLNTNLDHSQPPSSEFLMFCEKALGGVLGGSSAKALLDSALSGKKLNFEEMVNFFDETTQAIQFNASALFTSIESLEQGISVVDKNLNLVAWNKRYVELFDYPSDMVAVGTPVEKLVRYNATIGECGLGDVDTLVHKRLAHMKAGHHHKFIRQRSDGRMIEMVGNPLPGGGFVTSFNDITAHIEIQQALKDANIDLEKRVEKRGQEVQAINAELRSEIIRRAQLEHDLVKARLAAEQANASKTRFLALASHDVLQPLNAAKLYLSALQETEVSSEATQILNKLSDSVTSSEAIIATLLDISRLDQGEMQLHIEPVSLTKLLQPMADEFAMKAQAKGLNFRCHIGDYWVKTDKMYLYRIVQNFLSNAVKYTQSGGVLLSARRRKETLLLQVWDTGIGITDSEQKSVFKDFYRIEGNNEHGVGLGLSVVSRLAANLAVPIAIRSQLHNGSVFSVTLPLDEPVVVDEKSVVTVRSGGLSSLHILCVDDKSENLDAMFTLLHKWRVSVALAQDKEHALQHARRRKPDIMLIDYHLNKGINGIELIETFWQEFGGDIPAVLVTANQDESIILQCKQLGIGYMSKPIKPAKLRALLNSYKIKS